MMGLIGTERLGNDRKVGKLGRNCGSIYTRFQSDLVWGGFYLTVRRTASQPISRREAARTVPNFAQPIILAYGTCARYSVGALYGRLRKSTINGAKAAEH